MNSAKPSPAPSTSAESLPAQPRLLARNLLIPGLGVLALTALGWWFFKEQENQMHRSAADTLRAIVDLKSQQIQSWRRERLVDAQLIRVTPYMARRAFDAMAVLGQRDIVRGIAYRLKQIVADDVGGAPAGLDPHKADTLGLRLNRGLVAQLGGTLEMANDPGAVFRITFHHSPDQSQNTPDET